MKIVLILCAVLVACTAPKPEGQVQEPVAAEQKEVLSQEMDRRAEVTFSLSNNPLMSGTFDARTLVQKNKAIAMLQGVEKDVPDAVKLDLAISAYRSQNWGELLMLLDELVDSRDSRVKSHALNLQGVLAVKESRLSEASGYFQEALKVNERNEAALLNLGFLNLKFGYFDKALPLLLRAGEDWFARSGLIVSKRMTGDSRGAEELCDEILKTHPKHKTTLFNCGLLELQSKGDVRKARTLIEKAIAAPGGERDWNAEAVKLLRSL